MSRMLASWGVALAVLSAAGLSFGQDKSAGDPAKEAEGLLAAKELRPAAATYIWRGEDEVKKAAETAESRLKEYRHAHAREKAAVKEMYDKKAWAADLTKQRDELKQEMDQALPQLRAQVQALQQQQAALRMQTSANYGSRNRYASMQNSQINAQVNQLGVQITMLQAQSTQFNNTYADLNNQIKQLESKPDTKADEPSKTAARFEGPTSLERRETYVQALAELRKHVDETSKKYTELADDTPIKAALATLSSQHSAKVKYVLGPSKKFLDTVKALEQAEAKAASDTIIEEPKATASAKHKTMKTAKKK